MTDAGPICTSSTSSFHSTFRSSDTHTWADPPRPSSGDVDSAIPPVQGAHPQEATWTSFFLLDARITWTSRVGRLLLNAAFAYHTQSHARHFPHFRPTRTVLILLTSLGSVAGTPSKSTRSTDVYQSPDVLDTPDDLETSQATTVPPTTGTAEQISSTDPVPLDGSFHPEEPSPSGVAASDGTTTPTSRSRSRRKTLNPCAVFRATMLLANVAPTLTTPPQGPSHASSRLFRVYWYDTYLP